MFQSAELKTHLETSHTLQTQAKVYAEWNMNEPDNIARLGNYRYRPRGSNATYKTLSTIYDVNDTANFYTGATDADTVVDGGYSSTTDLPTLFVTKKEKMTMLYSLEDCIKPFRPRSGINKLLYLGVQGSSAASGQYINNGGVDIATRPRYYMSSRDDQFKYWTSYRTEGGTEYGVSGAYVNGQSNIEDAVPFVVYKNKVPTNRIVIKMQTNVGTTNIGTIRVGNTNIPDPLYGAANQTTPVIWKVQTLTDLGWKDIQSFDANSRRPDGTNIIGADGYVELAYGLQVPDLYKDNFTFAEVLASPSQLPVNAPAGYAYLVKTNDNDKGTFYTFADDAWKSFPPLYTWGLAESIVSKNSKFASDLVNPEYFYQNSERIYREIQFIKGIRIVVSTMNKPNATFDLIEFSPRLAVDLTDRVQDFSVTKTLSDLGNSSIPVGSLLAGTGSINLNNNDAAFSDAYAFNQNTGVGSIVSGYLLTHIKFNFYEVVRNVSGYDYYVPLKTMYSEGFPQASNNFDVISLALRDAYFIFESAPAPSLLMQDISLSNAIVILLDYIGFSNYVFKRKAGIPDPIIPYFFVAPNQNVAEVLVQLAVATQSAMFFDEYNNFVVMMKEYLLPDDNSRAVDTSMLGNSDGAKLPNIIGISSQNKKVYNGGEVNYTKRYIQRSTGTLAQAMTDEFKTWLYVPTLVWEVSGTQSTKSRNEAAGDQSSYTLSAMPLKSDLTSIIPTVVNGKIINNIINVGESVYFTARYQGYFYANGEVIRYDAVEYAVTGQTGVTTPVWITSADQYQDYFLKLPFNGKMYPTGNIRIYVEPNYYDIAASTNTLLKNGAVVKHGRGQFGTPIVNHKASIDPAWTSSANLYGIKMESQYLFDTNDIINYPLGMRQGYAAGVNANYARQTTRNGVIKNTLSQVHWTESQVRSFNSAQAGTVQSSALVFAGPSFGAADAPRDYVSYINKTLDKPYKHVGTRMRIIGKVETGGTSDKVQTPIGSTEYFSINPNDPTQNVSVSGGSGGIGMMVNPTTNNGYFFEIEALTAGNLGQYNTPTKKQVAAFSVAAGNAVALTGTVTITTDVDHTFKVGDTVTVSGFNVTQMLGDWQVVSVPSARVLTYSAPSCPDGAATTGGIAAAYISTTVNIHNLVFYKVVEGPDPANPLTGARNYAIPQRLWSGIGNILVDSGNFTGQYRTSTEENVTVYDLAIEYKDSGSTRTFYLYVNDKQVATVVDTDPLTKYNNACIFIRGSSKCMFENIYALSENYGQNTISTVANNLSEVFGDAEVNSTEALRKYALSGFIQQSYLSGISSLQPPQYNIYFDEFGTIMREAAYFNIKYDKAFPALYARLAPTLNRVKSYSSSGFYAGAYGADFLIFNCVDTNINLDSTTGNFLRIQGVTFTQNTTATMTVDDYFKKRSNLSQPIIDNGNFLYSPLRGKEQYEAIKVSRMRYGQSNFTIESPFIQSTEAAENILGWVVKRTMKPKKNIGISVFGMPTLQLGDLVNVKYKNEDGIDVIADPTKLFVVYNIEYTKSADSTATTVFLAEV